MTGTMEKTMWGTGVGVTEVAHRWSGKGEVFEKPSQGSEQRRAGYSSVSKESLGLCIENTVQERDERRGPVRRLQQQFR